MIEHIARAVYYCGVHLLYASVVWCAVLALTSVLRASATATYWIWVSTSLNFVVPVGAILDRSLASHVTGAHPLTFVGSLGLTVAEHAAAIGAIWLFGVLFMLMRLGRRLRAEHRALEAACVAHETRSFDIDDVPVELSGDGAPAVHGLLRPRIRVPAPIARSLSKSELCAVLLHELTHAKRRDNLIRLCHELALCVLWFHPLMWITSARLDLFRELSCDEQVVRSARGPDLVSALAKLTDSEGTYLLAASAASSMTRRLAVLDSHRPLASARSNAFVVALFAIAAMAGVYATVAHTACCFIHRR